MKSSFFLLLISYLMSLSSCFHSNYRERKALAFARINYRKEIFCSDNVLWQIHFGNGFKNDTIKLLHNKGVICVLDSVSTAVNECTATYLSLYNRNGRPVLFIQNKSKLDSIENFNNFLTGDSLKLTLEIRNQKLDYNADLKKGKFHMISLYHSLQAKVCIECE